MPCLRPPAGVLALELTLPEPVGVDLGGEFDGSMEPKPRPRGSGRAELGPVLASSEELFARNCKPCRAPYSVGSGVTVLMVAWEFAGVVGLVTPGRYAVFRRLPAEVLRGNANLTGVPAPGLVGEASVGSRSRAG